MKESIPRTFAAVASCCLIAFGLMLAGCGGSGSGSGTMSSQVVSGTASVGAPLAGQAVLKDSSATTQQKTTVIGSDGSFAFDVTGMKAPFIIQAAGSSGGTSYKLHTFASTTGTANANPLSNAAVASAAEVNDPETVFTHPDSDTMKKIDSNLSGAVTEILSKLKPLLLKYNADSKDPIKDHYTTDHTGLDGMFDNVKITLVDGILTITNTKTGAVIFTGKISDLKDGTLTDDDNSMPSTPTVPATPANVTATGGSGQVTISWSAVSNATSYKLYYATVAGVTTANGTKVASVTSPYIQGGLNAGTTYYYIVTAVNSAGESVASAQVSATTSSTPNPVPTVPAAPTGIKATGGTNQVTLSWSAVSTATSYNVYWSTTTGVTIATGTKISNAVSPAVHSGLAAATSYYYIVTAVNSAGESVASVQAAATTLPSVPAATAPSAPTGVMATGGANQVSLSWPAVTGATSYNVYWSTTTGVTTATGTKIAAVSSPYVLTGLSAGTGYYFVITAVNSVGESAASAQAMATTNAPPAAVPAAPTGVSAVGAAKQVTLSWPAVTGATSYNIYWSTTAGVTTASGTKIAGATTPYVQTGLADGTTYYYVVTAVNVSGESAASTQASAATNAPVPVAPSAPTGVSAVGATKQVTVSWSPVTGATSYNIYWSTVAGVTKTSGTKIAGATSPYVQTGLADGTTYYYIVTAVNAAGESVASAQASGATSAAALDGAALYGANCSCHGSLATSSKRKRTAAQIQTAINNNAGGMGYLSTLTPAQVAAIATALNF